MHVALVEAGPSAAAVALARIVVESREIAPTLERLAELSGLEGDALADAIADGEAEGWLAAWESGPHGFAVTLGPVAVAELRLEVCPLRRRWVHPAEVRQDRSFLGWATETDLPGPNGNAFALDGEPDPDALEPMAELEALEAAEAWLVGVVKTHTRRLSRSAESVEHRSRPPRPRILLEGVRSWDGPGQPGGVCPVCGRLASLTPTAYCLRCDRSGVDHLLPKPTAAELAELVPADRRAIKARKPARKPSRKPAPPPPRPS